jgi:major membrane immunogen (membrane-anchored lipoprotein)
MKQTCMWVVMGFIGMMIVNLLVVGCGDNGGPTGPSDAPELTGVTVNPPEANPGAILVFSIAYVDISGDLNGGTAVITLQNGDYQETVQSLVSNAEGTTGTLTTSITLSPLVPVGELVCSIFVLDRAGNASNTVFTTVQIL